MNGEQEKEVVGEYVVRYTVTLTEEEWRHIERLVLQQMCPNRVAIDDDGRTETVCMHVDQEDHNECNDAVQMLYRHIVESLQCQQTPYLPFCQP